MRYLVILAALLLSGCATFGAFSVPGTYPIKNKQGKVVAQIQTVIVKPQDVPPVSDLVNPVWWLQCGGSKSSFTAPASYLPNVTNQTQRDFLWWLRNPACNFVGFIVGFEGQTFKVTGSNPSVVTLRDVGNGSQHGFTWSLIDGWAPFVSYWDGTVEFYLGWRPTSGGLGAKFAIRK